MCKWAYSNFFFMSFLFNNLILNNKTNINNINCFCILLLVNYIWNNNFIFFIFLQRKLKYFINIINLLNLFI